METTHTPGQWTAHPSTRYRGNIGQAWDIATSFATWDPRDPDPDRDEGTMGTWSYDDIDGTRPYCRIATTSDMGPEAHANARLIAAAPELLDALKRSLALIEALMPGLRHIAVKDYGEVNMVPIDAARTIAKAEGRAP